MKQCQLRGQNLTNKHQTKQKIQEEHQRAKKIIPKKNKTLKLAITIFALNKIFEVSLVSHSWCSFEQTMLEKTCIHAGCIIQLTQKHVFFILHVWVHASPAWIAHNRFGFPFLGAERKKIVPTYLNKNRSEFAWRTESKIFCCMMFRLVLKWSIAAEGPPFFLIENIQVAVGQIASVCKEAGIFSQITRPHEVRE